MKQIATFLLTAAFTVGVAFADDSAPTLVLSKAAKLAEDAIKTASLPADCFLRSIALIQTPDSPAYYRATYKPPLVRRVQVGTEPPPPTVDIIRITMDGKVSFEQEELRARRVIQAK